MMQFFLKKKTRPSLVAIANSIFFPIALDDGDGYGGNNIAVMLLYNLLG